MAYGYPFSSPHPVPKHEKSCPPPRPDHPTPPPKIPLSAKSAHIPSKPQPVPKPSPDTSPLSAILRQIDGDTLLLLIFLWLASKESCDRKLLLALGYIML